MYYYLFIYYYYYVSIDGYRLGIVKAERDKYQINRIVGCIFNFQRGQGNGNRAG